MQILLVTTVFPSPLQPNKGAFNREMVRGARALPTTIQVVAPVAWPMALPRARRQQSVMRYADTRRRRAFGIRCISTRRRSCARSTARFSGGRSAARSNEILRGFRAGRGDRLLGTSRWPGGGALAAPARCAWRRDGRRHRRPRARRTGPAGGVRFVGCSTTPTPIVTVSQDLKRTLIGWASRRGQDARRPAAAST